MLSATWAASTARTWLSADGDGDRCGVVDDEAREIFADKIGPILAWDRPGSQRPLRIDEVTGSTSPIRC